MSHHYCSFQPTHFHLHATKYHKSRATLHLKYIHKTWVPEDTETPHSSLWCFPDISVWLLFGVVFQFYHKRCLLSKDETTASFGKEALVSYEDVLLAILGVLILQNNLGLWMSCHHLSLHDIVQLIFHSRTHISTNLCRRLNNVFL